VDAARLVMDELIEHGTLMPVTLGLDFQELDPALREVMELPNGVKGVLVNRVDPGGAAEQAGIRRGDVISKLDGRSVSGASELFTMLETAVVGQVLEMEVFRNDHRKTFRVTAEAIPDNLIEELANRSLGVRLVWKNGRGYVVERLRDRGPSALVGILRGDVFVGLNGVRLDGEPALRLALLNLRGRPRALAVVRRGNGRYHVTIPLR